MSYYVNKNCPYCGGNRVETFTQEDPMSFNFNTITKNICIDCGREVEFEEPEYTTTTNSTSSAEKYCENCNTKLEYNGTWYECPNCHYGYMDYIGDIPKDVEDMSKSISDKSLYIPSDNTWGVGTIKPNDLTAQNTLTITKCEKIKMHQKEMDVDFEFDTKKLENIDTIVINGYKYVKEK